MMMADKPGFYVQEITNIFVVGPGFLSNWRLAELRNVVPPDRIDDWLCLIVTGAH